MQAAFILLVILAIGGAEEHSRHKRLFLINSHTVTNLQLVTVTSPTIIPVTCWTSNGASVSQCTRSARNLRETMSIGKIDEKINRDELFASIAEPLYVEPTVAPSPVLPDQTESTSTSLIMESPLVESSDVEAEINDLEHSMLGRSPLGITKIYTVNTALLVTQYAPTVSGSVAFEVNGCTPSNFCFPRCT